MTLPMENGNCDEIKKVYPQKFIPEEEIFRHIHRGDRIFIHTACGEPQYLVQALIHFVESNPKAFFDAEVIQVWTLGSLRTRMKNSNLIFATTLSLSATTPGKR